MRKALSILVAVAALSFAGACGTSGGNDDTSSEDSTTTTASKQTTTTATEAEGVEVAEWAQSFCDSFGTWLEEIKGASESVADNVTPGDIDSAKTAIAGLFGTASSATQTLIDEMEDGGAPDIEDGDQLVEDLIEKFEAFDAAALSAQSDTEALATDDIATFQDEADALTTQFQDEVDKVADSFDEIDTKYPSPELNAEINAACSF